MINILLQVSTASSFFTSSILNTLIFVIAMTMVLAVSLQLARGYFLRILKKFTLRVAADIWWLLYIILKDAGVFLTVFFGIILFWPGVYQSSPIAVPFAQLAIVLFAIALVLMLIVDTEEDRTKNNILTLLMLAGTFLYLIGIIFVTEGPLTAATAVPTVSSSTGNFWGFANTYFNSINNPALAIYTFYVTFSALLLCGLVAIVYSFKPELFSAPESKAVAASNETTRKSIVQSKKQKKNININTNGKRFKLLFILLALIIVAIFVCAVYYLKYPSGYKSNWTTFTLNQNNSRYQRNTTINANNVDTLKPKWFIGTNSYVTSNPVVSNGSVYFTDWNGSVYSANLSNGNINWKTNLTYAISSTPTIANGIVYIALGPEGPTEVVALSQKNGSVIWKAYVNSTEGAIWGSPTVFNNMLYIGTGGAGGVSGQIDNNSSKSGEMVALNALNGRKIWNFTTMIGNTGGSAVWSSAAVDPNLNSIYFGTGNSYTNNSDSLYAYSIISLNATTGKLNWFYAAHNSSAGDLDFGATPNLFTITINGTTYDAVGDGSKDGYYYIVNRLNGNLLGKYLVGTAGPSQGIIGLSAFIYLKPNDPEIFIPSYYDSYNGCCGVVEALVPSNNTTEWRFYTHGNIRDSITLIPGTVLVGDNDGYLYAISASTGNQLLVRRFYDGISGGISAAGSYVIVPTSYSGVINETGVYALST